MTAQLFYLPFNPVFNSTGLPAGAASAYFFYTGTTTPAPVYADSGLTQRLPNPVPAGALGDLPNIYMDGTVTYRIRIVDANGATMGADVDNYIPGTARKGDKGDPGGANNTYATLTQLQATSFANGTANLAAPSGSDGGVTNGPFEYRTGNFTGQTGNNVVQLNGVPLTTGALVRVSAAELAFGSGSIADALGRGGGNSSVPNLLFGPTANASWLFLGDSFGDGFGASAYSMGMSARVARSILNANDFGPQNNGGYGYQSVINMYTALLADVHGVTSTGNPSFVATGAAGERLSMPAGSTLTLPAGRVMRSFDLFYDAVASTPGAALTISINGTVAGTTSLATPTAGKAVDIRSTGTINALTLVNGGAVCQATDQITFGVTGGTAVITGMSQLRGVAVGPMLYTIAHQGYSFANYTSAAAMDEIAAYLNALARDQGTQNLYISLGRNSIYNAPAAQTPAAMVVSMQTLLSGLVSRCSRLNVIIEIPAAAKNATRWPVQTPGYAYADYITAMVNYCTTNGYPMVRQDLLTLPAAAFYDEFHPNDAGYAAHAGSIVNALGIADQPLERTLGTPISARPTLASNWNAAIDTYAHKDGNTVSLSGIVTPAGGATTTVLTVPGTMIPNHDITMLARADNGFAIVTIASGSGVMTIANVPTTALSLDGITFQQARP